MRKILNMIVKFPIAMKCAFGENPKRCYQNQGISSRMTNAAMIREALDKAKRRLDANVNFDLTMELLMLEIKENG